MLRELLRSKDIQVVGVVRSTRVLNARYGFLRGAFEQWRRSGLAYTTYLGCSLLPRMPAAGLAVHATRDVNDAASRAFVERLAPEVLVTAFFNQRVGPWIHGKSQGVNLHPSLLPELRGTDPVFRAMLRGESRLGITLHWLAPELDAGDIVAQQEAPLVEGESVLGATVRLYALGARLLVGSLDRIRKKFAVPQPASRDRDYTSWPTRDEVVWLRRRGVSLMRLRDLRVPAA